MSMAPISAWSVIEASAATLIGVVLFFVIIGVFGPPAAITALVLFVLAALLIFRRPQAKEPRQ